MVETRLPNNSQRTVIVGRTGTGKTIAGMWHLSKKNFATFPWIVWDTKRDTELKELWQLPAVKRLTFSDMPGKSGLYYIQPLPHEMEDQACEDFLWKIHKRGKIGLYFDEGYALDKYSKALAALYTQGRSLHIPMITLSQRPSHLNLFTFTEMEFLQVFDLNYLGDRKRIAEYSRIDPRYSLREYHSLWYDVKANSVVEFSPVPAPDLVLESFEAQLRLIKRAI